MYKGPIETASVVCSSSWNAFVWLNLGVGGSDTADVPRARQGWVVKGSDFVSRSLV